MIQEIDTLKDVKLRRLSKLQRWILEHTYYKTVLAYTAGIVLLETYDYTRVNYSPDKRNILKPRYEQRYRRDLTWNYLFRNEILFNYFNRKMPRVRKRGIRLPQRFKGKGNKEQVILTNSLANMKQKGLMVGILIGKA